MVVAEQPLMKADFFLHFFQKTCQAVVDIPAFTYNVLNAAGGTVRNDVIYLVGSLFQTASGFRVL